MEFIYKNQDLFSVDSACYLAHCISADYALGKGIAVELQHRYDLRWRLEERGQGKWPDCIIIGRVFNLVTKPRYFDKPTYASLEAERSDYGMLPTFWQKLLEHESWNSGWREWERAFYRLPRNRLVWAEFSPASMGNERA